MNSMGHSSILVLTEPRVLFAHACFRRRLWYILELVVVLEVGFEFLDLQFDHILLQTASSDASIYFFSDCGAKASVALAIDSASFASTACL